MEALCEILGEIVEDSSVSGLTASSSAYRVWSAWFDAAPGEVVGRTASEVDASACTGDEVPTGEFETVDTQAVIEEAEGDRVKEWLASCPAPVLRLTSTRTVDELATAVLAHPAMAGLELDLERTS